MTSTEFVTVRQAARRVHRSEETVRRWIWSGRLPAQKRGNVYYLAVADLESALESASAGAPQVPAPGQLAPRASASWTEFLRLREVTWADRPRGGAGAADLVLDDRDARAGR
jgi:excisionase family DNA binding protein